ncbi:hypothetical protein [Pseudoxanthomonas sp.]|uniref:hypothetical protein n=1 Tax=Pseudoxanthomonas sp. TaxID=1871049 RepID=UPI002589F33A|nr:hypothetical protein [Pseudoxanthomonas sp.]MCR6686949.1 hypothetical protein [Pseudoxanthomonas sp.]
MARYYALSEDYAHDHGLTSGPALPDGSILAGQRVDAACLPALRFEIMREVLP